MTVRVCGHAIHVCRTMLMNVHSQPGLRPRVHTHVPLHHLHPTVVLWPTCWICVNVGEHLWGPLDHIIYAGSLSLGLHHRIKRAWNEFVPGLSFCFYAVVPSPFFLSSREKSGGFETLYKGHREENFAETFEVFSPSSVLRNVITPKKHFQKKHKVADWSQTMPTAPSSSSKSWYCCRGYLCSLFLCAPPEFIFISAPCWGLVRKWGQGSCHFGPRSTL